MSPADRQTADVDDTWPVRTEVVGFTDSGSTIRITAGASTSGYSEDPHPLGDLLPLIRTRAESPYVPLDVDREEST